MDYHTIYFEYVPNVRGEFIQINMDDPLFKGVDTKKIYNAHRIIDLTTGYVIKDRYTGKTGQFILTDDIRKSMVDEHFDESLFVI